MFAREKLEGKPFILKVAGASGGTRSHRQFYLKRCLRKSRSICGTAGGSKADIRDRNSRLIFPDEGVVGSLAGIKGNEKSCRLILGSRSGLARLLARDVLVDSGRAWEPACCFRRIINKTVFFQRARLGQLCSNARQFKWDRVGQRPARSLASP